MDGIVLIAGIILAIVGSVSGYLLGKKANPNEKLSEDEAIRRASQKAQDIIIEAEKKSLDLKKEMEEKAKELRNHIQEQEIQINKREKLLQDRSSQLDTRENRITQNEEELHSKYEEIKKSKERLQEELEKIAGLSKEEAEKRLMNELEENLKSSMAKKIKNAVNQAEIEANEKTKEILVHTMQNVATDFVADTTTTSIELKDENLKGRIIGKEGRNIRAFELATGVDVIIDESPDHIGLSSFDPLRREIGALSMKKLIEDGRIHPGKIEEIVEKVKRDISEEIIKNGKNLAEEADWVDIPAELIKLLGKMKYRTSYGQSLMKHTLEVMNIGELLAKEVGADVSLVKKACLLHDIGKILSQKLSKPHHHISGDIARKYGLNEKLVNAIEAHHDDIEPKSVEAVLVGISDSISGARPGARKETYESYIKRVQSLENLTRDLVKEKLSEVYAIHAGREIRVIVKPEKIDDDGIVVLANKIAQNIEKTQTYPGTIQVTVIRESRAIGTAK